MSSVSKFFSLSLRNQWLLGKVFVVLAVYKCLLLIIPFNQFFNKTKGSRSGGKTPTEATLTTTVWAISVISNRIPLGFTCLVQALAAKWLLKDYSDIRVCIGVHKGARQEFSAHAWVVYKNKTILGEQSALEFEPILDWQ